MTSNSKSRCMNCDVELTEKNSQCCWETECQNSSEFGEYCLKCYPLHMEIHH